MRVVNHGGIDGLWVMQGCKNRRSWDWWRGLGFDFVSCSFMSRMRLSLLCTSFTNAPCIKQEADSRSYSTGTESNHGSVYTVFKINILYLATFYLFSTTITS